LMKKLSILLIGLLLVSGLVFAQEPTVEGEASLTFGIDLEDTTTGFKNAASSSISLDWLAGDEEKGTTGWISLTGWEVTVDSDEEEIIVGAPDVEAGFMFEPITVTIYSAPDFKGGNASGFAYDDLDEDDARDQVPVALANKNVAEAAGDNYEGGDLIAVPADEDAPDDAALITENVEIEGADYDVYMVYEEADAEESTAYNGLTVTADLGVASLDVQFASDGTWENSDNDYAVGAVLTAAVAPLDLAAEVWAGPFDEMDLGFSFDADATVGESTIGAAFDGWIADGSEELEYDASLLVGTGISGVTLDALTYFYLTDAELDLDLEFVLGADDMVEGLGFTETFQTVNVMSATEPMWHSLTEVSYLVDGIKPYASFGINDASVIDLTAGVQLSEMVENTVFTAEYAAEDIENDNGTITFDATISF
ncbi:MAG: hypothetical protein ACOCU9_04560, partial [Spirochaetota bacterium]